MITVIEPAGYAWSRCVHEVGEAMGEGVAPLYSPVMPDSGVVLLPHLLQPDTPANPNVALYNLEQFGSGWLDRHLDFLRKSVVWDYSWWNIVRWRDLGVLARHVPISYHPCLTRIALGAERPIDVLFYGSVNARRQAVLDGLRAAGLNVVAAYGVFGQERDALIARSKVVVNIHYYSDCIFEVVRCSYLMANRVCVVSEDSREMLPGVVTAPYWGLVDACRRVIDTGAWIALGEAGYSAFAPQSEHRHGLAK